MVIEETSLKVRLKGRDLTVYLNEVAIENMGDAAKVRGLSISAFLRVVFSTPVSVSDTIPEIRKRIHDRLEEARAKL